MVENSKLWVVVVGVCMLGWSTADDVVQPNRCNPRCGEHGSCYYSPTNRNYYCRCDSGYSVLNCKCDPDNRGEACQGCVADPCDRGYCDLSIQANGDRKDRCKCDPGYTSNLCEDWDYCVYNLCPTNSYCVNKPDLRDYRCYCNDGYSGDYCNTNINECSSNPCVNGVCEDGIAEYTCTCYPVIRAATVMRILTSVPQTRVYTDTVVTVWADMYVTAHPDIQVPSVRQTSMNAPLILVDLTVTA